MPPAVEMVGKRFGKLTVISRVRNDSSGKPRFLCLCDCGNDHEASGSHLRRGNVLSCGCHSGWNLRKHNMRYSREYSIWMNMKTRCLNPLSSSYKNYGALGIRVCKEWQDSFEVFYSDMGACPENYSLERKDPCKGYSKNNCCWIPLSDQGKNKRNSLRIEYKGQKMGIHEVFETLGIAYTKNDWDKVYQRMFRHKWTAEKAFQDYAKEQGEPF